MSATRNELSKISQKRKISINTIQPQNQRQRTEMNDDEEKTILPHVTPRQKRQKAEEAVKTLQMEFESTLSSSGNTFSSLITKTTTIVKNDLNSDDAKNDSNASTEINNDLIKVNKESKSIDIAKLEMLLNESKYLARSKTPKDIARTNTVISSTSSKTHSSLTNSQNNNINTFLAISEDLSSLNKDYIQKSSIVFSKKSNSEVSCLSGSQDDTPGCGSSMQDFESNSRLQSQALACNSAKLSRGSSQSDILLKRKSNIAANKDAYLLHPNSNESNKLSPYTLSTEEFITPDCVISSKNQEQGKRVQPQDIIPFKVDNDDKFSTYNDSCQGSAYSQDFKKLSTKKEQDQFKSSQVAHGSCVKKSKSGDSSALSQNDIKCNINNSYDYINNLGCPSSPLHTGIDKEDLLTVLTPLYKNSSTSSQENISSWLSISQSSNSVVLQSNDDPLLDDHSVADPHLNDHHLDDFHADPPIGSHSMDSYDSGCNILPGTASQQYDAVQAAEYQSTRDLFDTLGSTFQERVMTEIETFLYYMRQSFEETATSDPEAQEIRVEANPAVREEAEQYELLLQMHRLAETITANICCNNK